MKIYRVDYVTADGDRGIWHGEREEPNPDGLHDQCRREFDHVADQLRRNHGKTLRKLIVVEITETDVRSVRT